MERKGKRNLEDIIYTRQTLTSTHDNVDSYMANKINVFCWDFGIQINQQNKKIIDVTAIFWFHY